MTTIKDIRNLTNENNPMLTYDELNKYSNQGFYEKAKQGLVIFLPTQNPKLGHWVCVIKNKEGLYYFDPYGYEIDKNLALGEKYYNMMGEQMYPHLSRLFLEYPGKISYNNFKYQDKKNSVHCGRWCALRIYFKHLTEKQFRELVNIIKKANKLKNYDDIFPSN